MSLIQEALRRQQEEMNRKAAEAAAARPPAPSQKPEPPPSQPPPLPPIEKEPPPPDRNEPKPAHSPLLWVVAFSVATTILIALLVVVYRPWEWLRSSPTAPASVSSTHQATRLTPASEEVASPSLPPSPSDIPRSADAQALPPTPEIPSDSASPTTSVTGTAPRSTAFDPPLSTSIPSPPSSRPPQKTSPTPSSEPVSSPSIPTSPGRLDLPAEEEPILWPPLKVTGIIKMGNAFSARLDNRIVGPGETVNGIELVKVTEEGAVLRYRGKEKTLRVGESTR